MTRARASLRTAGGLGARHRRALALIAALLTAAASVGLFAPTVYGDGVSSLAPVQLPAAASANGGDQGCARGADPFLRTELFFGSAKPDGTAVTEKEFQGFLDAEVTPRFPDGLTLLTGLGQFRGSSGKIVQERSMLLILLYPKDSARSSSEKIEQIRAAYLKAFQQESVLRADDRQPSCVSF